MISSADLEAFGIDPYKTGMAVETYKKWQPSFASYSGWTDLRKRQEQATKEMVCEATEVLAEFVKANRKGRVIDRMKIVDELGDTFWGLVGVMNEFNISFNELCTYNVKKLTERNSN